LGAADRGEHRQAAGANPEAIALGEDGASGAEPNAVPAEAGSAECPFLAQSGHDDVLNTVGVAC